MDQNFSSEQAAEWLARMCSDIAAEVLTRDLGRCQEPPASYGPGGHDGILARPDADEG